MTDKLSKYENDEISNELLLYLRRNFTVTEHKYSFADFPIKMINIEEKTYLLDRNKKSLVNKLYSLVSDSFGISERVARRTIKKFLDGVS